MADFAQMTQAEQVLYFKIVDNLLAERVMESERIAKDYAAVCIERARAYAARTQAMSVPLYLKVWAAEMSLVKGNQLVRMYHNYLPWLDALMVVRYGEAVEHWPESCTEEDVARARAWKSGKLPDGIREIKPSGIAIGGMMLCWAVAACVVAAAVLQWLPSWTGMIGLLPLVGTAFTDYMEDQLITHLHRTGILTVPAWAASTVYVAGDIVRPTTWNNRLFECVVGGTSAGTEPTWVTTFANEQADNTVTWQTIAVGVPKRPSWWALYTAAPGETGGGTEVSGGSYARVANHPLDANWTASSGGNGTTDNVSALTYPAPTANWGTVTHTAELNRSTGGNMRKYGALTTAKTVNNGDAPPSFAIGSLDNIYA